MKLRQLECFRTLMIQGTMTRTAEVLGISQPAVSNLIADLARQLGVPLFTRRLGRLFPTSEAELLYREVGRALEGVENVQRAALEIREGRSGHLSIAAYASISISLLPKVMAIFLENRPGVQIKLVTRSSHLVPELISTEQFDIVFAEMPADYPSARTEVFSYRCQCVMPPDDPLAKKDVITPRDLDGKPFIALVRDAPIYQQIAWAFSQYGAKWNVVAQTEYYASACQLVRAGRGVSVIDPVISSAFADGLVCKPFEPEVRYDVAMLYNSRSNNSSIALEFTDLIRPLLRP